MSKSITVKKESSIVYVEAGHIWATSLSIAEKFGKLHKNVLQSIENLECSEDFRRLNFQPSSYVNENNKTQPMYKLTRDGFSILVMGFTGKEAMAWKIKFLEAFNAMEKELLRVASKVATGQLRSRREGKVSRLDETDEIKNLIEYAIANGSKNHGHMYSNYTKMVNKLLGIEVGTRDLLTEEQLGDLSVVEYLVKKVIRQGLDAGVHYNDIYYAAKAHLETCADAGMFLISTKVLMDEV